MKKIIIAIAAGLFLSACGGGSVNVKLKLDSEAKELLDLLKAYNSPCTLPEQYIEDPLGNADEIKALWKDCRVIFVGARLLDTEKISAEEIIKELADE